MEAVSQDEDLPNESNSSEYQRPTKTMRARDASTFALITFTGLIPNYFSPPTHPLHSLTHPLTPLPLTDFTDELTLPAVVIEQLKNIAETGDVR